MKHMLWIARDFDGQWYGIYHKEPTIVKSGWNKGRWTYNYRMTSIYHTQIHKHYPNFKLKKGEKKQFTITT